MDAFDPHSALTRGNCRVLVVDDHPLVREGMVSLLSAEADMEVCGQAVDIASALEQVAQADPEVIVIDLSLKDESGIELIERIHAQYPSIRMLVSSVHDESLFAERVLRAGAAGYINKQEAPGKIIDAIRRIRQGETYLSPAASRNLLRGVIQGETAGCNSVEKLSAREREVFAMIGKGLNTRQIAAELQLSPKTVETHREKIKKKLNLPNSTELGRHAIQWALELAQHSSTTRPDS